MVVGPIAADGPTAPVPLDRKSTSFPAALGERLKQLRREYERLQKSKSTDSAARTAAALRYTQYVVRAFYSEPGFGLRPPNGAPAGSGGGGGRPRGLLLDHEMGQGKTRAAAAIAEAARSIPTRNGKPREVVVLLTKSLQANFENEYDEYLALIGADPAATSVRYITSNAHNTAAQMARAARNASASRPAAGGSDPYGDIAAAGARALEGTVLVVEEAHNFFRAVLNQGKNAVALYEMMAGATDLYLVFLSGTVPSKDPFELAVCFNLLAGEEVLPSEYNAFKDAFVSPSSGESPAGVRNLGKYQNRILGLVSHVRRSLPLPGAKKGPPNPKHEFPERRATVVERLPMGPAQYRAYISARAREDMAAAPRKGGPGSKGQPNLVPLAPLSKPSRTAGSTYHVESRQLSNFVPPPGFQGGPAELPDSALTVAASPKMARVVEIAVGARRPVLVYSQFTGLGGLGALARYLEKAGFTRWVAPTEGSVSGGAAKADAVDTKAVEITRVAPDALETWMGENEERRASLIARGDAPEQAAGESPGAPTESQEAAPLMHWFVWAPEVPGGPANTYIGHLVVARGPPPDVPSELQEAADVGPWLAWAHVVSAGRRQGIARQLARQAAKWTAKQTGLSLRAAVPSTNAAGAAFLRSLGGRRVAEADGWTLYYGAASRARGGATTKKAAKKAGAKKAAIKTPTAKPLARLPANRRLHYAVHSGDVDIEERAAVEDAFRADSNVHGADIMVLLLSKTGAEGLNLRYAEEVVAMEPYWDDARPEQFYARVIRPGSHAALPAAQRWVQPRMLIAAPNPAMAADPPPLTTDEELYRRSSRDREIVDAFRAANRGASIEAVAFEYPGARLCAPTGARLYTETPGADLRAPDPCQPLVRREAKLAELALDGARIPYRADPASPFGWRFYRFDPDAGAHVPIPDNDPMIEELLKLVPATTGGDEDGDIWGGGSTDDATASDSQAIGGRVIGDEPQISLEHAREYLDRGERLALKRIARIERIGKMSAKQLAGLDWSAVERKFAEFMESRYETAGEIDLIDGVPQIVRAERGSVEESGDASGFTASGDFAYHTHPYALVDARKLHRSTRHLPPFLPPSHIDLESAFSSVAEHSSAWSIVETPEGRYFIRPDEKWLNSKFGRAAKKQSLDQKYNEEAYQDGMADLKNRARWAAAMLVDTPTTLLEHSERMREAGFVVHFFPAAAFVARFPLQTKWIHQFITRPYRSGTLGCEGKRGPRRKVLPAAGGVTGGIVESRARLPHRRRSDAWKTTNMASFLNRVERYAKMSANQIDALDWGPTNAFLTSAMNSRYETAGMIDRVRGKMHVVSAHRGEIDESGEGGSSTADVPGMFYYHTHPHALLDAEKLHHSTRHVLPFMHPSAPDLIVAVQVAADPHPVPWMMLEAPEGRYFWRPGPRITNSAMFRFVVDARADEDEVPAEPTYDVAKAEARWDRFQERVWEKLYGVRNRRSFTLHDIHEAIRKLGFTLYFFPDPGYARRFPIRSFRWVGTTIFRPEKRE